MRIKNLADVGFYLEKDLQKLITPEALEYFYGEWYRYMYPYIPYVTGTLADTVDISAQDGIIFKVIYATYQHNGLNFNFTKDFHPLAQAEWGEVAADLHGAELMRQLAAYIQYMR